MPTNPTNPCAEIVLSGPTRCALNPLKYYILNYDDYSLSTTYDVLEWGKGFEDKRRFIGKNDTTVNGVEYDISTVFIGMEDEIFETMAWRNGDECLQRRTDTYEEARQMHIDVCTRIHNGEDISYD